MYTHLKTLYYIINLKKFFSTLFSYFLKKLKQRHYDSIGFNIALRNVQTYLWYFNLQHNTPS